MNSKKEGNTMSIILLLFVLGILGYLFYALFYPERL